MNDPSGLYAESPGPGCEYVGTGPDGEPTFSCDGSPALDDPYWEERDPFVATSRGTGATVVCTGMCSVQAVLKLVALDNMSLQSDCLIDCIAFHESHYSDQLAGGFAPSVTHLGHVGLMQVGITMVYDVLFQGPPRTAAQQASARQVYSVLTDPAVNIQVGSAGLQLDIDRLGLQGGLMNYTGNNSREVSDVQNCASKLKPNDPSTYQAAFSAAIK